MAKKNDEIPTPEELGLDPIVLDPIPDPLPEAASEEPQVTEPKRRGRPKGSAGAGPTTSRPNKSQAKKDADTGALAKQIQGIHVMLGMFLQAPEMQLSDAESVMLAQSINVVSAEYGLSLSGKTGAAIQLAGTAALVYVPRALAISSRMKAEQEKKASEVARPVN